MTELGDFVYLHVLFPDACSSLASNLCILLHTSPCTDITIRDFSWTSTNARDHTLNRYGITDFFSCAGLKQSQEVKPNAVTAFSGMGHSVLAKKGYSLMPPVPPKDVIEKKE